jgi:uncharacterized membrane protein YciS (DUF1049 family)
VSDFLWAAMVLTLFAKGIVMGWLLAGWWARRRFEDWWWFR